MNTVVQIVNGWLVRASAGIVEVDRSLSCYITNKVRVTCVCTSWRYSGRERCRKGRAIDKAISPLPNAMICITLKELFGGAHNLLPIKYFSVTVSFGSVKSLISLPCFMSHVAILVAVREATKDVRQIPVGIEDVSDL
uniref:Cystathionine beta-lyase n=1 Tax=Solanum tuberosum TaxID=4113 RepID=M0ZNW5_SOLTU